MTQVYIAGPMTGHDDFNFPAFYEAEARWRKAGWDVVNPANPDWLDWSWEDCMEKCLGLLIRCDAIALLDGWQSSRGARIEYAVARECGIRSFDARHAAKPPVTDHTYIEGTNACCQLPDYMHLPTWRSTTSLKGVAA